MIQGTGAYQPNSALTTSWGILPPVKSEPHVTYVQPPLPIRKIRLPFPWSAGLSAVTVAAPQPLFVTRAPVSLKAELVKPHWPLAAAVNSAIWVALAGLALTGLADGTAEDRLGPRLADDRLMAGLARLTRGVGVALAALGVGLAMAVVGVADGAEPAPPQAVARHRTPTVSPASRMACRRVGVPLHAMPFNPFRLRVHRRSADSPANRAGSPAKGHARFDDLAGYCPAPGWSSGGSPMLRGSRKFNNPSGPSSRPRPDSLNPPNGTSGNGG